MEIEVHEPKIKPQLEWIPWLICFMKIVFTKGENNLKHLMQLKLICLAVGSRLIKYEITFHVGWSEHYGMQVLYLHLTNLFIKYIIIILQRSTAGHKPPPTMPRRTTLSCLHPPRFIMQTDHDSINHLHIIGPK